MMTECFPSPPPFSRFSNKRLSAGTFYPENIVDIPHPKNPFKRQRNYDINQEAAIHDGCISTSTNDSQQMKKNRTLSDVELHESSSTIMASRIHIAEYDRNHSNNIDDSREEIYSSASRAQFQSSIESKDREIISLQSSVQHQELLLFQTQSAKIVCEEENRILKRAVAIQDGRQKDLQGQNQQLQNVLTQAAEHIGNLERINRELRIQLEPSRVQYSFHTFDRPPDVF